MSVTRKSLFDLRPVWRAPDYPALLFHWQRFPLSLFTFEWVESDVVPTLKFQAYYLSNGVPFRRLVFVPVSVRHAKYLDFHQLIRNPNHGEKFYRLAHWRIVAWAATNSLITAPSDGRR